ncbi:Uncharacterized protein Rs2_46878 [Raphanus sativus]|nr:Uncharacterized protein Rs2_46878 [Raphanus sativus]
MGITILLLDELVSSYASLSYASPLSPAKVVKPLGSEDYARSCVLNHSVQPHGYQKETAVVFNVVAQVLGLLVDFQYIPAEKLSEISGSSQGHGNCCTESPQ